jgi:hypothetical protein
MQIDVFALLTEARQRIAANIAAIEAQRDFWLARSSLDAALIGGGAAVGENAARAPTLPTRAELAAERFPSGAVACRLGNPAGRL